VDKVARERNADFTELLTDKNRDNDWSVNENGHESRSQSSAGDIPPRPLHDTDRNSPRPLHDTDRNLPALAAGEPSGDQHEQDRAAEEDKSLTGWQKGGGKCRT